MFMHAEALRPLSCLLFVLSARSSLALELRATVSAAQLTAPSRSRSHPRLAPCLCPETSPRARAAQA